MVKQCTNPKGEYIGQTTKLKQRCIFCHNSRAQDKYTVINLIHTWHFVFLYVINKTFMLSSKVIKYTTEEMQCSKISINPTPSWITPTRLSRARKHRVRCSEWNNREDAYSRTGSIFIRDTARDTAYSLRFNEVWPYASLSHNEYAVSRAVSRMKMPPVREYASSLLYNNARPTFTYFDHRQSSLRVVYA